MLARHPKIRHIYWQTLPLQGLQAFDFRPMTPVIDNSVAFQYLAFSKNLANWLISNANEAEDYAKWPKAQGGTEFYISGSNTASDHYGSTPQIGRFFLNLYSVTSNSTYLNYAEKAARWLINTTVNISGMFMWNETTSSDKQSITLSSGAANVGLYFLEHAY